MITNFFKTVATLGFNDVIIQIKTDAEGRQTVFFTPKIDGVKDDALKSIQPLQLTATPDQLDEGFFDAIKTPLQALSGLVTNVKAFEASVAEAEKNAKMNKKEKEKPSAEAAKTTAAPVEKPKSKTEQTKEAQQALKDTLALCVSGEDWIRNRTKLKSAIDTLLALKEDHKDAKAAKTKLEGYEKFYAGREDLFVEEAQTEEVKTLGADSPEPTIDLEASGIEAETSNEDDEQTVNNTQDWANVGENEAIDTYLEDSLDEQPSEAGIIADVDNDSGNYVGDGESVIPVVDANTVASETETVEATVETVTVESYEQVGAVEAFVPEQETPAIPMTPVPVPPVPVTKIFVWLSSEYSEEQMKSLGWTEDALVQHGYAEYKYPATILPAPPAPLDVQSQNDFDDLPM